MNDEKIRRAAVRIAKLLETYPREEDLGTATIEDRDKRLTLYEKYKDEHNDFTTSAFNANTDVISMIIREELA